MYPYLYILYKYVCTRAPSSRSSVNPRKLVQKCYISLLCIIDLVWSRTFQIQGEYRICMTHLLASCVEHRKAFRSAVAAVTRNW